MENIELVQVVKSFLLERFDLLKKLEEENSGGKIRYHSGLMVEEMIDLIWNSIAKKYPNVNNKVTIGSTTPLKNIDEDGNFINESVDRHCFINDSLVLAIEAKTYLDKPYMQRANDDFKLMKNVKKDFHAMIISLENAIADESYNFLLNKKNINSVFFISDGKRNSKKERRIYNTPERINEVLILSLIEKIEEFFKNGDNK